MLILIIWIAITVLVKVFFYLANEFLEIWCYVVTPNYLLQGLEAADAQFSLWVRGIS